MKKENGHYFFNDRKEFKKWVHEFKHNSRVAYIGISNSYDNYQWYLIDGNLSCYVLNINNYKISFEEKLIDCFYEHVFLFGMITGFIICIFIKYFIN